MKIKKYNFIAGKTQNTGYLTFCGAQTKDNSQVSLPK